MKKKRLVAMCAITLALAGVTTTTLLFNQGSLNLIGAEQTYSVSLDKTNTPAALSGSKYGVASLAVPNKTLNLEYFNAKTISENHVILKAKSGYIASSFIRGIKGVTVTYTGGSLKIMTGLIDADLNTTDVASGVKATIDGSYFKLFNAGDSDATVESINFEYECSSDSIVDFKSNDVTYHGVGVTSTKENTYCLSKATNTSSCAYSDQNYIDLGSFPKGGVVEMEFHGKYKPLVAFFTEGGSVTPTEDGKTGAIFTQDANGDDLRIYKDFTGTACVVSGKSEAVKAGYNKLDNDKDYKIMFGCFDRDDSKYLCSITLFEKVDSEWTNIANYNEARDKTNFGTLAGDHIVIYASRTKSVEFKLTNVSSIYHNTSYNYLTNTFAMSKNTDATNNYTNASYIDLGNKFYNGGTVTLNLDANKHSRYIPTVQFFASEVNPSFKSAAINGITFHGDSVGSQYRVFPSSALSNAFVTTDGAFAGYNVLSERDTHAFTATIKCIRTATGYELSFSLYDVTTSEDLGSFQKTYTYDYGNICNAAGIGGHIVIYGSRVCALSGSISVVAA